MHKNRLCESWNGLSTALLFDPPVYRRDTLYEHDSFLSKQSFFSFA